MDSLLYWVPVAALVGLLFALLLWFRIKRAGDGNAQMKEIARAIDHICNRAGGSSGHFY